MIRFCTLNDIEQVNVIREEVNKIHAEGASDFFKPEFSREVSDMVNLYIDAENKKLLVCEMDNKICGYAMLEIVQKPENSLMYSRLYLHIVEFGVLEDYRGKGIGTQLLNEIKKLAKELNIKTINLLVWDFNQTALNFYKKMGFDVYSNSLKFEVE